MAAIALPKTKKGGRRATPPYRNRHLEGRRGDFSGRFVALRGLSHSITSFARAKILGGITIPNAFAVRALMIRL